MRWVGQPFARPFGARVGAREFVGMQAKGHTLNAPPATGQNG